MGSGCARCDANQWVDYYGYANGNVQGNNGDNGAHYVTATGNDSTDKAYLGGRRDGVASVSACQALCDAESACKMASHSDTHCWLYGTGTETLTVSSPTLVFYIKTVDAVTAIKAAHQARSLCYGVAISV